MNIKTRDSKAAPNNTKILFLIPSLGGGGSERNIYLLDTNLDTKKYDIHLGLMRGQDEAGANPLPPSVAVHRMSVSNVRYIFLPLFKLIRDVRPDVIFSGITHLNLAVLLMRPLLPRSLRIVIRQENTATAAHKSSVTHFLYRVLYPKADAIVCQSDAMADDLSGNFGIARGKIRVLANPVYVERVSSKTVREPRVDLPQWPRLLAVGRLANQKGYDLLLPALRDVKKEYPSLSLTILGEGGEMPALLQMVRDLGLEDVVYFEGHVDNPAIYYDSTTLFVLSSRFEGMPNAMLEAATAGLPVVTTPCCGGVCDLVQGASGVWMTKDISPRALRDAILEALGVLKSMQSDSTINPRFTHGFLAPFELSTAVHAYEAEISGR